MKKLLTFLMAITLMLSVTISTTAADDYIPVTANILGTFEVVLPTSISMSKETIEVPYFVTTDLPSKESLLVSIRNNVDLVDDSEYHTTAYLQNSRTKYRSVDTRTQVQESFKVSTSTVPAGDWHGEVDVVISTTIDDVTGAGLYDADGNLLASWDTLVGSYGLDMVKNTVVAPDSTHLSKVLVNFTNASKLVIPGSVSRIGNSALYGVTLDSVVMLEGVSVIGMGAFASSNIKELVFPSSLVELEGAAFQGGTFGDIVIPKTLVNFGEGNFYYTTYDSVTTEEGNPYYKIENGIIFDNDGKKAFNVVNNTERSYVVPEGVLEVASLTFENCTSMTSITLPESLTSIGDWAFSNTGLTSLYIPKNVNKIGAAIGTNSSKLKTVEVDPENREYCSYDNCIYTKDMKTLVYVPGARTGTLTLPEGVETIAYQAFKNSKLSTVVLPESLKSIKSGAFNGAAITAISIPKNVSYVGHMAFSGCKKLTDITLSVDNLYLKEIDDIIYSGDMKSVITCNPNITSAIIPEGVETVKYAALAQSKLTSVTLPTTLKTIEDMAFYSCSKIARLDVPETVTSIGQYAFYKIKKVYYKGTASSADKWGADSLVTNF